MGLIVSVKNKHKRMQGLVHTGTQTITMETEIQPCYVGCFTAACSMSLAAEENDCPFFNHSGLRTGLVCILPVFCPFGGKAKPNHHQAGRQ